MVGVGVSRYDKKGKYKEKPREHGETGQFRKETRTPLLRDPPC